MKKGLASGWSGVVLEILLAFGDSGIEGMTNLFNKIITKTSHQKIGIGVSLWTISRIRTMQLNEENTEG